MKIVKVKQHNSKLGWSILIKDFNTKDYRRLLSLIEKIRLKRDEFMEKKLWVLGGKIKTNLIKRIYNNLQYSYISKNNIISMIWKHPELNGKEFISLLLSN